MRTVAETTPDSEILWCVDVEDADGVVLYEAGFTSRRAANEFIDALPEHQDWVLRFKPAHVERRAA